MKQPIQSARTGKVTVAEVPAPRPAPGMVLVRTAASLVSAGTERMAANFAGKSLLGEVRRRPDMVRQVLDEVHRDDVPSGIEAANHRLDQPLSLGYSSAGTIVAVGEGVSDIQMGDRVACAGAGHAVHAELACVPRMLVAKIPEPSLPGHRAVSWEEASFATVGAIALHGVRLAKTEIGHVVAVIGLGLLGQVTVQLLKASGCRVLGMDPLPARAELALSCGADQAVTSSEAMHHLCQQASGGHGADAVLITADTTESTPLQLAAETARDKAMVVAVGAVDLHVPRRVFYEKELELRISRSYGPGRYDPEYEEKGRDYPIGFVRWTENRNLEAFLHLVADGKMNLAPLISHHFAVCDATRAYDLITGRKSQSVLGVMLTYPDEADTASRVQLSALPVGEAVRGSRVAVGLVGPGNFATSVLIPALKATRGVKLMGVCASTGASAWHAGQKFGFHYCTTDSDEIFADASVNTVVIATRHHSHGRQVATALASGKHVFCEKPLCLTEAELAAIVRAYQQQKQPRQLMVGFNRQFAPMTLRLKEFLKSITEPLVMCCRVNAGYITPDHWTQDPRLGGGRILGEVCHYVDWLSFLTGSSVMRVHAQTPSDHGRSRQDNVVANLEFANGSLGTITYVSNGDKRFTNERLEVFGGGVVGVLEDFRRLELVHHGKQTTFVSRWRQDKGHRAECKAFVAGLQKGESPMPFAEIVSSTLATLRILESIATARRVEVDAQAFISAAISAAAPQPQDFDRVDKGVASSV